MGAVFFPKFIAQMNRLGGMLANLLTISPPDVRNLDREDLTASFRFMIGENTGIGTRGYSDFIRTSPISVVDLLNE